MIKMSKFQRKLCSPRFNDILSAIFYAIPRDVSIYWYDDYPFSLGLGKTLRLHKFPVNFMEVEKFVEIRMLILANAHWNSIDFVIHLKKNHKPFP